MEQASSGQPFYLNDTDTVTVEQLKTSDLRSLGDNVKLLAVIQNLSQDLVTKSENTYKKLDEIQCETEIKSVGVKNLINEFQMLADSQFIENRIYDADQIDSPPENPTKSFNEEENIKTPPDQKILPIIHECISNSLKFIDENFNLGEKQLKQAAESDDEEDYVKETLARAMENNPFNKTPLPAIIGSHAFFNQSIFNDGDHPVTISQNVNQSELSSDKNSTASDESDEENDLLFSSNKDIISIKPGIIPPPPPMPNFKSLPDKDDDDDDATLFPTSKPTMVQPRVLPQLPPFPQNAQFDESDDEDDNDLFSTEKTVSVSPQIKPLIPPRITPQLPALPKFKPVENSDDDDDDDDDDLFVHSNSNASPVAPAAKTKAIKVLPSSPPQLKPMIDNNSDDEDSDDLFKPPKVKPRSSIASLQETLKPSSATIEALNKPPEKKPNVWDLDSDDDDEKLFPINKTKVILPRVLPQLPPLSKHKSSDESDEEDDDNLFSTKKITSASPQIKPQIPTRTLPDNPPAPILRPVEKNIESDDEDDSDLFVTDKKISVPSQKPQISPRTIPQIPDLPKLKPVESSDDEEDDDDDDDDNDDLFSINNSKSTTLVKVNEPLPSSPSFKIKLDNNNSDAGDSGDLFKPPKVKPRNSINIAPKTQETPKTPSATIEPPKRPPEIKSNNIWDLDSDDESDEALFLTNKTLNSKPQVIKSQVSLQNEPLKESDDDDESLFPPKETVTDQSQSLPHTSPLPVLKPIEKNNESYDEEDDDLFVTENTISVPPQIKPQIPSRTIHKISDLPVLNPVGKSDDDDDDDDLFAHSSRNSVPAAQPKMIQVHPSSGIKVLPSIPPQLKPMINNNSDDEDSDDLFKPPKVKPRSSIAPLQEKVKPSSATIDSLKRKPEKKPDIWDLDSDDDDLFKTVK